ncbi:uncharacterized protein LOC143837059 [Paroedura picta]|uniref:uncharacterized protein LOC143837059 n=1 Tax=Paroedura picta TaxID=143630 RepID=UPI0040563741
MDGSRQNWRRIGTAAPLAFLHLTLLISGAFALRCHTYTSIQPVSRDQISSEFSMAPTVVSVCSASQNACAEAHLMLNAEKTAMLVIHRGCASEDLKDEAGPSASGGQHLVLHSSVRYCHTDLCNGEPMDANDFKMPEQEKASEASSSNRCYSGFVLDPNEDIRDTVMCEREHSQCYHGNGTITVGHLAVDFLIKTCQDPTCNDPESQSFGPIELKLWGSCCHGDFCNGKMVVPQEISKMNSSSRLPNSTIAPSLRSSRPQPTNSSQHNIANDIQDTLTASEEVTVTPAHEQDDTHTTTLKNPLYDYEEYEDDNQTSTSTNNTLNPRAANQSPPHPGLPPYLWLVALGSAILRIW